MYAGWEGDSGNTLRGNTANDNARNGIYAFGATGEESFHEVVKSYGSMFLQDAVEVYELRNDGVLKKFSLKMRSVVG